MEWIITIILLLLWIIVGQLGFSIWRKKIIIEYAHLKEPRKTIILNNLISKYRTGFSMTGPAGLIYALNYKGQ